MRRTLSAALDEAAETIGRVDAHVLAAHLLEVNRAYLQTHPMRLLSETEDARLDAMVALRALGQPVAYLLERREFYGRDFAVGPDVLIPRPETELLVETALDVMSGEAAVADLGTGSGAIAVTIACERPQSRVTATDVSEPALGVARGNAARHRVADRMEFLAGSWYSPLGARRFDVIVANPPYVAARDPHLAEGDLRFEPPVALSDGSPDGLESIRAIVTGAARHLNPGGWLLLEHGYDQRAMVDSLLESAGFVDRIEQADLAGIPRVAGGRMPHTPTGESR